MKVSRQFVLERKWFDLVNRPKVNPEDIPLEIRLPSLAMEILGGSARDQTTLHGGATLTLQRLASDIVVMLVPGMRGSECDLFQLAKALSRSERKVKLASYRQQDLRQQLVCLMAAALSDESKSYSYTTPGGIVVSLRLLDGGAAIMTVERPWGKACAVQPSAPARPEPATKTMPDKLDGAQTDTIGNHPLCMARGLAMPSV